MKLSKEKREVLEGYFKSLGLNRNDRALLFRYVRYGGNPDRPLIIVGDPVTGKSMLTNILRNLGVCVYSLHETDFVTLKKRLALTEDDARYIQEICDKLEIPAKR